MLKNFLSSAARRVSIGMRPGDWDEASSSVADAAHDVPERRGDEEIMGEMRGLYFKEMKPEEVTASVLERLPESLEYDWLENAIWEHEHALETVNGEISGRVLSSYNEFVEGMRRIHDVGVNLQQSAVVCKNGRLSLRQAKASLAQSSLQLAAKYRRQQIYKGLIGTLGDIKRVANCAKELDAYLREGDYPRAIAAHLETEQRAAQLAQLMVPREAAEGAGVTYVRLRCVEALQQSLAGAAKLLRNRLDDSLRQACQAFDAGNYAALIRAFQRLGRTYEILGKLQESFSTDLERRSRQVVMHCVDPEFLQRREEDSLARIKFQPLCEGVQPVLFVPCLLNLLGVCTDVMWTFHQVKRWHDDAVATHPHPGEFAADKTMSDVKQGLETAKRKLWDAMQRNVATLLATVKLSQLQVEDAMKVVEAAQVFAHIGAEFGSAKVAGLLAELRAQSITYFNDIKRSMTEDLQAMLLNEQWHRLPAAVKVADIKELRSAVTSGSRATTRLSRSFFGTFPPGANPFHDAAEQYANPSAARSSFAEIVEKTAKARPKLSADSTAAGASSAGAPDQSLSPSSAAAAEADADADEEDEEDEHRLEQEALEDDDGAPSASLTGREDGTAIVTSSAINIVRKIGRYIHMMRTLEPVALDILNGIAELHNCYLWTVYTFFAAAPQDNSLLGITAASRAAKGMFDGIREQIQITRPGAPQSLLAPMPSPAGLSQQGAVPASTSPAIESVLSFEKPESFNIVVETSRLDMHNPTNLYGLLHRVVATESLSFLKEAFELIKPILQESLAQPNQRAALAKFLSQSVEPIDEVKQTMYRNVAPFLVSIESVPSMIEKLKWDSQMAEERPYISHIIKEVNVLSQRLEGIQKQGCLPPSARTLLWENVVLHIMDTLLEGFSRVKRCSNEGRALMTMDFQVLSSTLIQFSGQRPLPGASMVDSYIKAFYWTSEVEYTEYCRAHTEYTMKMLVGLMLSNVSAQSQMSRKQRSDLQTVVEDITRARQRLPLWRHWANVRRGSGIA